MPLERSLRGIILFYGLYAKLSGNAEVWQILTSYFFVSEVGSGSGSSGSRRPGSEARPIQATQTAVEAGGLYTRAE